MSVQFAEAIDWRAEPDEPDPDDEQIETPVDVIAILGFDPAEPEEDPYAQKFARALETGKLPNLSQLEAPEVTLAEADRVLARRPEAGIA